MKPQISITIPEPCGQRREDMRPVTGGWHCDACRQNVVDFSLMSDGAILAFVKKAAGSHFCGSFQSSQLNRALIPPPPKASWRNRFSQRMAVALFLAQLTFTQAVAQSKKVPVKTAHVSQTMKGKPRIIQGRILDFATRSPIVGASVKAAYSTTVTDKNGRFLLQLPAGIAADSTITIEASLAVGDKSGVILPEQVVVSRLLHFVTLYHYPQEVLPAIEVNAFTYKPVLINPGECIVTYTNDPQERRPTFFQHLLKPFKRKRRASSN